MVKIQVILLRDGHGGLVSRSEVQVGRFSPSGWEDGVGWGEESERGRASHQGQVLGGHVGQDSSSPEGWLEEGWAQVPRSGTQQELCSLRPRPWIWGI